MFESLTDVQSDRQSNLSDSQANFIQNHAVFKIEHVEEILHKRIFSWDVHLESKYVSHKRIRFCEQSVYAKSPLHTCLNCEFV